MSDKKPRLFVHNEDSGECGFYCGTVGEIREVDDAAPAFQGLCNILEAELEGLLTGTPRDGKKVSLSVYVRHMTDEEVAALPDM